MGVGVGVGACVCVCVWVWGHVCVCVGACVCGGGYRLLRDISRGKGEAPLVTSYYLTDYK